MTFTIILYFRQITIFLQTLCISSTHIIYTFLTPIFGFVCICCNTYNNICSFEDMLNTPFIEKLIMQNVFTLPDKMYAQKLQTILEYESEYK